VLAADFELENECSGAASAEPQAEAWDIVVKSDCLGGEMLGGHASGPAAVDRPGWTRDNRRSSARTGIASAPTARLSPRPMFSKLKAAWSRLAGGEGRESDGPPAPAVEYKGYRIRPTPYRNNGLYQTAGIIEKDTPEGVKEHRFIRADTHQGREEAIAFAVSKAKQIIDLQGDRIFAQTNGG